MFIATLKNNGPKATSTYALLDLSVPYTEGEPFGGRTVGEYQTYGPARLEADRRNGERIQPLPALA